MNKTIFLELIEARPPQKAFPHPLLFIHPIGHAAWYWQENFLPYFAAQGFHCCAMSLRGHGESEGKANLRWTSIKSYLADIENTIGRLPASPVLIGDSLGGMLVRKFLEKNTPPAAVLMSPASQSGAWSFSFKVLRRHPLLFLQLNAKRIARPGLPHEMATDTNWQLTADSIIEWLLQLKNQ